jgi:hypothetical protein
MDYLKVLPPVNISIFKMLYGKDQKFQNFVDGGELICYSIDTSKQGFIFLREFYALDLKLAR